MEPRPAPPPFDWLNAALAAGAGIATAGSALWRALSAANAGLATFPGSTALDTAVYLDGAVVITMRDDSTHDYECSPDEWDDLRSAPSAGAYFNAVFRPRE